MGIYLRFDDAGYSLNTLSGIICKVKFIPARSINTQTKHKGDLTMKQHILTFGLIAALALTMNLFAQRGFGPKAERGSKMEQMLELTDEQQETLESLRLEHRKEMLPLKTKLKSLEGDLKLEMTAEEFAESEAKEILTEMEKVRTEMHLSRLLHQQDVRNMLTPEQRQTFDLHLLAEGGMVRGHGGPPHGGRGKGMQRRFRQHQ